MLHLLLLLLLLLLPFLLLHRPLRDCTLYCLNAAVTHHRQIVSLFAAIIISFFGAVEAIN